MNALIVTALTAGRGLATLLGSSFHSVVPSAFLLPHRRRHTCTGPSLVLPLLFLAGDVFSGRKKAAMTADAHGYLTQPKPRNVVLEEEGGVFTDVYMKESLNNLGGYAKTSSLCGSVQSRPDLDMDDYPSSSQATYVAGELVTVRFWLTVSHNGHLEFSLCPADGTDVPGVPAPSHTCFESNKLEVVEHVSHGGADPDYPHRAMFPSVTNVEYEWMVRIPDVLPRSDETTGTTTGTPYVLKAMYVTANSCTPEGYHTYTQRVNLPNGLGWDRWFYNENGSLCPDPYSNPPPAIEEVFHNCADIKIVDFGNNPVSPGPGPVTTALVTTAPVTTAPVTPAPVTTAPAPPTDGYCCGLGYTGFKPYDNCKQFYTCANGEIVGTPQPCPQGLFFDTHASTCNWPSSVNLCPPDPCNNGGGPTTPTTPATTTPIVTATPAPTTHLRQPPQ
uniref:Chitin-binding type-2 domain-containing protein n=1 Tax=Odontella aurita TaxID=265563 RepID=A0A7S4N6C0_9STRA|mmetsp:Transcript_50058/g.150632  ORF Transcript_50058/g.150632 Transcript_50058/m.150632 type:complete len:445 (+) Transcript_50058:156-1490(+)|eukprot:CAMPEP_0113531412 /NCGR_PEP_ID=MMETSP0015_2-20120614/3483_1 /TAXON_ID=2838 /ORGANISM="Odontella" /LENGTH=444 /DNA_ID=CAMNT_0000430247 /DNA_START=92 /DNA_END=1426 /DNA_ORIENTATION=- /assembly_acc=CAM_ASM_000160